jgi:hypothetical protein
MARLVAAVASSISQHLFLLVVQAAGGGPACPGTGVQGWQELGAEVYGC